MKFDAAFDNQFKLHLELLGEVGQLTEDMGRLLAKNATQGSFIATALQFAKISVESPENILRTLRGGNIAHAVVLSRWYLEMAHLCFYLWSNPEAHRQWLAGKNVRPQDIGKWFVKMKFPTWWETYEDWSNVVHHNSVVVSAYHTIAVRTPASESQLLIAGRLIRNLLFISTKLNYVFGKALQPHIGDKFKELALRYNAFENRIFEMSDAHNRWERSFMGTAESDQQMDEAR